jgi:DNA-binding response OmpR family regulator
MGISGRILIADDEELFLDSTAGLLRKEGYECACVKDGATADDMLRSGNFDLLIADIRMPGNPGLELIRRVRELPHTLPVIIATGYPSLESAIQSMQLPVVAYLVKPFEFSDLLTQVERSVGQSHISHAIDDMERYLEALQQSMRSVQHLKAGALSADASAEAFRLIVHNIAGSLIDLNRIWTSTVGKDRVKGSCHEFNCPRTQQSAELLRETIATLENTRHAFKSQQLADLRKKLQRFLMGLGE